jgi:hypothetical protein
MWSAQAVEGPALVVYVTMRVVSEGTYIRMLYHASSCACIHVYIHTGPGIATFCKFSMYVLHFMYVCWGAYIHMCMHRCIYIQLCAHVHKPTCKVQAVGAAVLWPFGCVPWLRLLQEYPASVKCEWRTHARTHALLLWHSVSVWAHLYGTYNIFTNENDRKWCAWNLDCLLKLDVHANARTCTEKLWARRNYGREGKIPATSKFTYAQMLTHA